MESDRELLELAAMAAGIDLALQDDGSPGYYGDWRGLPQWEYWNPLTNDGDALRLAVELRFNVYHAGASVYVEDLDEGVEIQIGHERDKFAATRRAIVLAAAELGSRMKDADKERK